MNKIISIIIASYNVEDYLERNLSSIVKACHRDEVEAVVINDGSTDGTLAIAQKFQTEYPEVVKVINKPNGHYGSCINAALKIATGKYFRVVDADDWVGTEALDSLIERLQTSDVDLAITMRTEETQQENGSFSSRPVPITCMPCNQVLDISEIRFPASGEIEINMHTMAYKTSILRKAHLQLPEGICYTDLLYCMIPLYLTRTLEVFDIYLYHYYIGRIGNSTNMDAIRKNFNHFIMVARAMCSHLQAHQSADEYVLQAQLHFMNDIIGFILLSMKQRWHVNRKVGEELIELIPCWKKYHMDNRLFHKYYFRLWWKYPSRRMLNFCLALFHITHPSL